MEKDMGEKLCSLRADGGASANNLLMQFQADISDIEIHRPVSAEATARGAAFLAGLACGFYRDRDELEVLCRGGVSFTPKMDADTRRRLLGGWDKAVGRSLDWEDNI